MLSFLCLQCVSVEWYFRLWSYFLVHLVFFIYSCFMSFLDNSNGIFFRQESYFAYLFGVREPGFYGAIVSSYCCFIFPFIWDSAICQCLSFIYTFPDWYGFFFFFTVSWVVDYHPLHNGTLFALYYYIRHIWHFYLIEVPPNFVEMPPNLHQGVDVMSKRLAFLKGIKAEVHTQNPLPCVSF